MRGRGGHLAPAPCFCAIDFGTRCPGGKAIWPSRIYELCGEDEEVLFSPHCWKTRLSIAHKGLDWETVPTPFTAVAATENGDGRKVPVIRDGETVVEESFEIAKYLDKQYPDAPELVGGETGEAMTQMIINWSQTQVHPAVVKISLMEIFNGLAPADKEHFRTTREKMFGKTLEEFQAQFDTGDFSGLNAALLPLELTLRKQPYIGGETPLFRRLCRLRPAAVAARGQRH